MTLSRNSNFLSQNEINSLLQVVTSICEEKSLFSYDCEFISHNSDYFIRIANIDVHRVIKSELQDIN